MDTASCSRIVFVEIIEENLNCESKCFEVDLSSCVQSDFVMSDLRLITDDIIDNIPSMKAVFDNHEIFWKVAGTHFPDRFLGVEKNKIPLTISVVKGRYFITVGSTAEPCSGNYLNTHLNNCLLRVPETLFTVFFIC